MGLEAAQYLDELDLNNPTFQDFVSEGDDHVRGIKRAAKQTFPGMAGRAWRKKAVSASGPLVLTDNMTLVIAGQALTLTPAAASVLGNGWMVMVRATGGAVTVDPAENINGAASVSVPTGYTAIVMSDGVEFFSMLVYQDVPVAVQAFSAGTKIVFQQTAAPTGWTKITSSTHNNSTLRFTTGTVGTGGVTDFTTTFGTGKATAGHTLTEAQLAPHVHPSGAAAAQNSTLGSIPPVDVNIVNTGSAGGGASHSHNLNNMDLKFVDCITASKD
jgi:hypothetical protein